MTEEKNTGLYENNKNIDVDKEEMENTDNEGTEKDKAAINKENEAQVKEIEKLKGELESLNDKYLRLMAEYENYRKRTSKERETTYCDACTDVISEILPILDNLERAGEFAESGQLTEGIILTLNMFRDILKKLGVTEIEAENSPFDPNIHNAVMHIEDENYGENMVTEVFSKGYKKGDKIIRYAMVKVAN